MGKSKKHSVAIIGAGGIGAAIGKVLEKNKEVEANFWDIDTAKLKRPAKLEEVCAHAGFLFLCVPSWAVRAAIKDITPCISKGVPIISVSKGIEEKTLKNMNELLAEIIADDNPWSLLSGPMLAGELEKGLVGAGVIAAQPTNAFNELKFFPKVQSIFMKSNLFLEYSLDTQGVALCGVLKNIYAIAIGSVSALKLGGNATGLFVVKTLEEMTVLAKSLGGRVETVFGPAGVGDFIATAFSEYSKNRRAGEELIKKGICSVKSEGCLSIKPFRERLEKEKIKVPPLFEAVYRSLEDPRSTKTIFLKNLKSIKKK